MWHFCGKCKSKREKVITFWLWDHENIDFFLTITCRWIRHNKTRDIHWESKYSEFWFDVISLKQHLCSPMTSLSCWGMSSFHWLMDGWAKSMLMSRYWGASRLVLKVKTVPSFVTYSYSASKLSISFTHGNKPVIIKIYMRSCQQKPSIFIWIIMFLCICTSDSLRHGVQVTVPQSVDGVTALSNGQQHITAIIRHLKTHTHTYVIHLITQSEMKHHLCVCLLPQRRSSISADQEIPHTGCPETEGFPTHDSTASGAG